MILEKRRAVTVSGRRNKECERVFQGELNRECDPGGKNVPSDGFPEVFEAEAPKSWPAAC